MRRRKRAEAVAIYTIYDHPRDFPAAFVVREWRVTEAGPVPGRAWRSATLDGARRRVPAQASHCLARDPEDDRTVVETWI